VVIYALQLFEVVVFQKYFSQNTLSIKVCSC